MSSAEKEKSMKKAFRKLLILTLIICLTLVTDISVTAYAASGERLSVSDTKLWLSSSTELVCTLEDHKDGEELTFTTSKKGIIKTSRSEWDDDKQIITIKARKAGTTTLTIRYGDESCKVRLYVRSGEVKTAEEIYSSCQNAMAELHCYDSIGNLYVGSGFFIGNGRVATNYHVIESAVRIVISDYNGTKYSIESVLGYDAEKDVAIIEVSQKNKNAMILSDASVITGERIYTIGSPYGYTGTLSDGIVALANRSMDGIDYIQITAATSIGNGGGPLINSKGEVIGINTLTVTSAQNLNFAIPVKYLTGLETSRPITISDFYAANSGKVKESNVASSGIIFTPYFGTSNDSMTAGRQELTPTQIYEQCSGSMVEITAETVNGKSTGAGFFVADNVIVTNFHVISGATGLQVVDYAGRNYEVETLYDYDSTVDIAVLGVKSSGAHEYLQLDIGYMPAVGERIYTIGSPLLYTGTFSEGIVSMSQCEMEGVKYIQIEAPISRGNSGGPLLSKYGAVIGVNTLTQNGAQNVNFAIRIDYFSSMSGDVEGNIEQFYKSNLN